MGQEHLARWLASHWGIFKFWLLLHADGSWNIFLEKVWVVIMLENDHKKFLQYHQLKFSPFNINLSCNSSWLLVKVFIRVELQYVQQNSCTWKYWKTSDRYNTEKLVCINFTGLVYWKYATVCQPCSCLGVFSTRCQSQIELFYSASNYKDNGRYARAFCLIPIEWRRWRIDEYHHQTTKFL